MSADQITIGDFHITVIDGELIIRTNDGEGGSFSIVDFEQVIDKFYCD